MRILLIGHDGRGPDLLTQVLEGDEIGVHMAQSGEDGLGMVRHFDYDLILIGSHGIGGMDTLRALRKAQVEKPILMLCAEDAVSAKVGALNAGADDCLARPFSRHELVARIRSLVRRSRGLCRSTISIGAVTLDLTAKAVEVNGAPIRLTAKEYQMLELLFLRQGVTQSRETIINHIYLDGEGPESNTVGLFVYKLRRKLAALTGDAMIETVRDRGYMLRAA